MTKRRSSGDGSVFKVQSGRDAGKWVAMVDLGWSPEGKRQRRRRVCTTERDAKAALKQLLELRDSGVIKVETVHQWADYWLEHVVRVQRKATTYEAYRSALDWAKRGISPKVALLELTPVHVRQMHAYCRSQKVSESRIWYVTNVLGICLNAAVDERLLVRSPVRQILAKMPTPVQTHRTAILWTEAVAAIDATTDPLDRAILAVAFMAGPRPAEVVGLRREDLDLWRDGDVSRGVLRITGQIGHHGGVAGQRVTTKSANGLRDIPLEALCAAILSEWLAVAPASTWMFPGRDNPGRPMHYEAYARHFKNALKASGVPVITPHGARATFTTRLLDQGVSVAVAAKLLGDKPETLIRHYARSSAGIERDAIRELEERPVRELT